MNISDFLKILGLGTATIVTLKIIFDVWKNLSRISPIKLPPVKEYRGFFATEDMPAYSMIYVSGDNGSLLTTSGSLKTPAWVGITQHSVKKGEQAYAFTVGLNVTNPTGIITTVRLFST